MWAIIVTVFILGLAAGTMLACIVLSERQAAEPPAPEPTSYQLELGRRR